MLLLYRLKKYLSYQWRAKTKYYLHSPFVYRFYLQVLENKDLDSLSSLAKLRRNLRHSRARVHLPDFGTRAARTVSLSELEKLVAVQPRYGQLLFSIARYFEPGIMLEIGTSIGLSSAYMALGNPAGHVITLEGASELIEVARENHGQLSLQNIEMVEGEFSMTLPEVLQQVERLDLVYFDGNHTYSATIGYFERCLAKAHEHSIFIFDDIYWSREMTQAWEMIKKHPKVTLTIDVYRFGICFFISGKLAKEDFVLRY